MMEDRNPDIMGWSETNIEWHQYTARQKMYQSLKRNAPGGVWRTATSSIPADSLYKPGGNLMIIKKTSEREHRNTPKTQKEDGCGQNCTGNINPYSLFSSTFHAQNRESSQRTRNNINK